MWVNTWNQFDAAVPFGGYKLSGIGREHGEEVLNHYTQVRFPPLLHISALSFHQHSSPFFPLGCISAPSLFLSPSVTFQYWLQGQQEDRNSQGRPPYPISLARPLPSHASPCLCLSPLGLFPTHVFYHRLRPHCCCTDCKAILVCINPPCSCAACVAMLYASCL